MSKIPKVIHYCWFGYGSQSPLIQKCIKSWKNCLPEYTFKEWNELNFDIDSNIFVKQAYETGQWAFVPDYVRFFVLYNEGGIYLDTDVEVFKNFDPFLEYRVFIGFENRTHLTTGIIGSEKRHPWVKEMLNFYNDKSFIDEQGNYYNIPNVLHVTNMTQKKYNLVTESSHQILKDDIHVFPFQYFSVDTGIIDAFCHHHYIGSWTNSKNIDPQIEISYFKRLFFNLLEIFDVKHENWQYRLQQIDLIGKRVGILHLNNDFLMQAFYKALSKQNLLTIVCYFSNNTIDESINNLPIYPLYNIDDHNIDVSIIPILNQSQREFRTNLKSQLNCRILSIEDVTGCYSIY